MLPFHQARTIPPAIAEPTSSGKTLKRRMPLCRLAKLPVEIHIVNLAKGEHLQPAYKAINPLGKVSDGPAQLGAPPAWPKHGTLPGGGRRWQQALALAAALNRRCARVLRHWPLLRLTSALPPVCGPLAATAGAASAPRCRAWRWRQGTRWWRAAPY